MHDVVVTRSCSPSHLLMSFCLINYPPLSSLAGHTSRYYKLTATRFSLVPRRAEKKYGGVHKFRLSCRRAEFFFPAVTARHASGWRAAAELGGWRVYSSLPLSEYGVLGNVVSSPPHWGLGGGPAENGFALLQYGDFGIRRLVLAFSWSWISEKQL